MKIRFCAQTFTASTLIALLLVAGFGFNPQNASADPYCQACPYSCDDLGLGRKDCSELSSSRGLCCLDLTQKGLKLAKAQSDALGSGAVAAAEHCPSGFQPSEQKCTQSERRNGCKDIRLPGGLGCVNR